MKEEEIKNLDNYALSAWMDIPTGGQWRYEVRNLAKGYNYYARIDTAISDEQGEESSAPNN